MKMSILLGVSQMNLGIILSYFDAKFHGSSLDVRYVVDMLGIFCVSNLTNQLKVERF